MKIYAKNSAKICLFLFLLSLLQACGSTKYVPVIEYVTLNPCPRPQSPYELLPLENNYLDSPQNAQILAKNRLIQDSYLQAWIDAVLCYEKQLIDIKAINE